MAVDSARTIEELSVKSPADFDLRSETPGQLRSLKILLKRTFSTLTGDNAIDKRPFFPLGAIGMYSGKEENLPPEWVICDGRTVSGIVTPDLRGKFVMAATPAERVGASGSRHIEKNMGQYVGAAPRELTYDQMPPHQHEVTVIHNHRQTNGYIYGEGPTEMTAEMGRGGRPTKRSSMTSIVGTPPSTGDEPEKGHTHEGKHLKDFDVRPAYYVLAFIMFVGMGVNEGD